MKLQTHFCHRLRVLQILRIHCPSNFVILQILLRHFLCLLSLFNFLHRAFIYGRVFFILIVNIVLFLLFLCFIWFLSIFDSWEPPVKKFLSCLCFHAANNWTPNTWFLSVEGNGLITKVIFKFKLSGPKFTVFTLIT